MQEGDTIMRAHVPNPSKLARGPATEEWARIDPMVYVTAARRLQAQATAEAVAASWRGIRSGLTGLAALVERYLLEPIARRSERDRASAELAAMDDRLLADIGLRRSDIPLAVDGCLARPRGMRRPPLAAALASRVLEGERCVAPAATANSNRPPAPARPELAA
jgi:uncharacterized protein YjiS (DUF1127 family)